MVSYQVLVQTPSKAHIVLLNNNFKFTLIMLSTGWLKEAILALFKYAKLLHKLKYGMNLTSEFLSSCYSFTIQHRQNLNLPTYLRLELNLIV